MTPAYQVSTGTPAGGMVAADTPRETPDAVDPHLVSLLDPTSYQAEQYRSLRTVLEQMHASKTLLAVTSAVDSDGKTTTAINLAGALAHAPGARVLIVDLDLRAPSVGDRLGLRVQSPGVVDAILDPGMALADAAHRHPQFNLWAMPAGQTLAIPYELLKSERLAALLREARQQFTYVILDTPPMVPMPDSRLIGDRVDGIVMVVAAHHTPRRLVAEALQMIDPAKLVGIVFNGDDRPLSGYYGYYGYGYGRYAKKRRRGR